MTEAISFIVAANDDEVLHTNFLASGIFSGNHPHEIIIQKKFNSASIAYNDGIEKCKNDLMVFTHQDMYFPEGWDKTLKEDLHLIEQQDPKWGVIGCFGIDHTGTGHGYIYCNGQKKILGKKTAPKKIRVLDEIVLIFKKSSGLKYDPLLPGFHMYGTDICLISESGSRQNYAISNLAVHNTLRIKFLAADFMKSLEYIRKKYKKMMPIITPCFNIKRFKLVNDFLKYKIHFGVYRRGFHKIKSERIDNPESFYQKNLANIK